MLFTQLFEDDFNNKKKLNEGVSDDDYEDCSYCSGTGEGRWEGSTCAHCQGSGVEPVSQDDDDFEEPDDVADMDQDEESYYEKSLRSRGLGEETAGKFQLPGVGSWLNVGQQQQATDDTPGNFSIVVAGRQGKDFQAITLAKALETILPKDYPRSGWPNTPGSDRSPTHYVIQEVLNRGQAVVKDGIGSKDVADSIAVKFKKYGIPAYVEGALEEQGVAEGTQTVGHEILGMLRQVRRQGHDAMEELYSSCPLLAQYWDEYEGDFRSMVIELSPKTLNRIKAEIAAFNQQGVAEGLLNEFAPGGNSASSYYAVTANFVSEFSQQKEEEIQDLIAAGWTKQDLAQAGTLQGQAADIAHFEQVRDSFLKGLKPGFDAYLQGDTQMKDQLGEYWLENDLPLNQDWEKIYGEPWGDDTGFAEGVAEAIPYALSAANANAEFERQRKNRISAMPAGGGYRGRVELDVESREDYIAVGKTLAKAAAAAGQHIDYGLSGGVMKVFSDSMTTDELDTFIDDTLENFDQGVAEARAATARFRTGNKKRAELNAMSDEERRAYDKEQQEKQRRRDDARLERERQKLAAKKGVAEGIFGSKENSAVPLVNKIAQVARQLTPQNVNVGKQIIQSNADDILRMMSPQAKTGVEVIEQGVAESRMAELDAEYEDYKKLSPREFFNMYKITKQAWLAKYKSMLPQQSMDEDVRLPYPVRSEKLGRANMELLVRAYNEPTSPRIALSFGDRILELDRDDVEAIAHYYDNILKDDNARWNFVKGIMSDPDGLTDVLIKLGRRKPGVARQPGLFQEADKKKDDDLGSEVKDVVLQRAITKAKADFPTAGSGLEALAKDFMRSQEQDQKSFDQLRQAERKQDSLLSQINKIDQEQTQEINDLENQNSGLSRRLQQLQNVNSELEKKLAAMSGRRAEKTSSTEPMPTSSKAEPAVVAPKLKPAKGKKVKDKKAKSLPPSKSQPALAAPAAPSAMSSVAQQLTTQHPNVLEPDTTDRTPDELPRFRRIDTTQATDVPYRTPTRAELPGEVAQNVDAYADAMVGDKLRQTVDQELAKTEDKQDSARIRAVKKQRSDGSVETTYEVVNARGVTIKTGMSKETAQSALKAYKQKYMAEQEPGNRAGYNAIKTVSDWAEKLRTMQELQKDIKLMADPEAKSAVQQRMGELLKLGVERGYTK